MIPLNYPVLGEGNKKNPTFGRGCVSSIAADKRRGGGLGSGQYYLGFY